MNIKKQKTDIDNISAEYDFSSGVPGKHYHAMQNGYTVTIHHQDGSTEVKEITPIPGVIQLDPDVQQYFPDSESVNTTLRELIRLIPKR